MTGSNSFWFANPSTGFYPEEISTSLRMEASASPYLIFTPSSDGNKKTYTFSVWFKRSNFDSSYNITLFNIDKYPFAPCHQLYFHTDDTIRFYWGDGGSSGSESGAVSIDGVQLRDVSSWYNIVLNYDTTQSTKTDRIRIFINGVRQTLTGFYNGPHGDHYPTEDYVSSHVNVNESGVPIIFGAFGNNSAYGHYYQGYMAELNFIDGTNYDASNFGETKEGVWVPKEISGLSYGTNGCRLQFANTATGTASSSTIGADTSGQNNHRSTSGLTSPESAIPDTPTNNWSTFNNLVRDTGRVLTYGGLRAALTGQIVLPSTFEIPSSGKWYFEMYLQDSNGNHEIGVYRTDNGDANFTTRDTSNASTYFANGEYKNFSSQTSGFSSYGNADKVAVAVDMDNLKIYFAKNNTWQNSANPSSGSNGLSLVAGQRYVFNYIHGSGSGSSTGIANFGQDSSFAGRVTQQNNADANNRGDFFYAPPTGFLALCSANLPEPTISPNATTQADDYFDIVTWTGNASNDLDIDANFNPDWLWIKAEGTSGDHALYDSNRGNGVQLISNTTGADATNTTNGARLTQADGGTGFEPGALGDTNSSGNGMVAWLWKANGGTTSSNSEGDVTSTVQANTTSGFSIVTFTGSSSGNTTFTVGHGLGAVPQMIIAKQRNSTSGWSVYHHELGEGHYINLNSTDAKTSSSIAWGNTAPTSTVFSTYTTGFWGTSAEIVAYCFSEIEGYSRFGEYKGNALDDGTYVYLGFRPRWLMLKNADSTESGGAAWIIYDTERSTSNVMDDRLYANQSTAEQNNANYNIDFLSNGFKIRDGSANYGYNNANTYIYMAFAEIPFKYANAR